MVCEVYRPICQTTEYILLIKIALRQKSSVVWQSQGYFFVMDDIMNKRPSTQFYPGDWWRAVDLRKCCMATQGCWFNMLLVMWDEKEQGKITGTKIEICRVVGCDLTELQGLLDDNKKHEFCDVLQNVTECNEIVTIINRRMHTAFLERERAKQGMRKHRAKQGYENVTPPSSTSSSTSTSKNPPIPPQKSLFETVRKEYPGTKRGLDEEWDYLDIVCRKHKLNREQTVPKIVAGVSRLLEWRSNAAAAKVFVPPPKNFKTWLYNRCWTDEFPEIPERKKTRIQLLNEQREARKNE